MPELSRFYGIIIRMLLKESGHNLPHIHAVYGDDMAVFSIEPIRKLEGRLTKRAEALVLEWIKLRKNELQKDWDLIKDGKKPKKIKPLE